MYEVLETAAGFKVLCNGVPMTVHDVHEILPYEVVLRDRYWVVNFLLHESAQTLVERLRGCNG